MKPPCKTCGQTGRPLIPGDRFKYLYYGVTTSAWQTVSNHKTNKGKTRAQFEQEFRAAGLPITEWEIP